MDYSRKLLEYSRKFSSTKYSETLNELYDCYLRDDWKRFELVEKKFPSDVQLLENLIEKLKGKSVYSNLRKIFKNESVNVIDMKVTLSSLITHLLLEEKQGGREYSNLIKETHKKLGDLI